jgi:hypothetical protein
MWPTSGHTLCHTRYVTVCSDLQSGTRNIFVAPMFIYSAHVQRDHDFSERAVFLPLATRISKVYAETSCYCNSGRYIIVNVGLSTTIKKECGP